MEQTRPERLLRLPQVLHLYPISRSSWYEGIKKGIYPAPVKISPRCSAWRESDVLDLLEKVAG